MVGLLVIDAVGWRSMYLVVMPKVNLIVILLTYARYLYSINCPTVICLPSMLLFILWRDTTSELWTQVQFPLHCYLLFTASFPSVMKPKFNRPVGERNHFRRLLLADFGNNTRNLLTAPGKCLVGSFGTSSSVEPAHNTTKILCPNLQ
jgi:hypothetical protein